MSNTASTPTVKQYDLGTVFLGQPVNMFIDGWDKPWPYTPPLDKNFFPSQWFVEILRGFRMGENLWVFGPQGSGKTSAIKRIAAGLNWPVYEITAHGRLEFPELCGGYHVADGNMVWHDGPLAAAMRNGGLFLLNEADLLTPDMAAGFNSILDGSPLFVPELNEYIQRHPEFRFVATANTNGSGDATGLYQGTLRQNMALQSRFLYVLSGFLSSEEESRIIEAKVPALPKETRTFIIEFANMIREAYIGNTDRAGDVAALPVTMSPRDLIRWGKLIVEYEFVKKHGNSPIAFALDRAFAYRVDAATRTALHEMLQRLTSKES